MFDDEIAAFDRIKVAPGTKFAQMDFSESANVYDNTGKIHNPDVTWDRGKYKKAAFATDDVMEEIHEMERFLTLETVKYEKN